MDILAIHSQMVHMEISSENASSSFLYSAVYGSPRIIDRKEFWSDLGAMVESIFVPWLIVGDFNSILDSSKRVGGANIICVGCNLFQSFMFDNRICAWVFVVLNLHGVKVTYPNVWIGQFITLSGMVLHPTVWSTTYIV